MAERLLIAPALIVMGAGLSVARGEDPFADNPPAGNAQSGAANDEFQMPLPADPNSPDRPHPAPPDRWVRRSAQLREAAQKRQAYPQDNGAQPAPPMTWPQVAGPQIAGPQVAAPQMAGPPMIAPPMAGPPMAGPPMFQQPAYGMAPQPAAYAARIYGAPTSVAQAAPKLPSQPGFQTTPVPGFSAGALPPAPEKVPKASDLRKVTTIQPFLDYEPDPEVAKTDPCRNLCPRPEGCPPAPGGKVPDCPKEYPVSEGPYQPPMFTPSVYNWEASNIWYNPLYFEDDQLERYGHAWPFFIQPAVSIAQFTVQAIGLPYQMTLNPPHSVVYPLGHYRPGECSPKLIYQIPLNCHAAVVEAAAITGTVFLFPVLPRG